MEVVQRYGELPVGDQVGQGDFQIKGHAQAWHTKQPQTIFAICLVFHHASQGMTALETPVQGLFPTRTYVEADDVLVLQQIEEDVMA